MSLPVMQWSTFCPRQTKHERSIVLHAMQMMTSRLMPRCGCAEIDSGFFYPDVIGDFPEEEARQFFTDQALPRAEVEIELSKDDWAKVWEVRGNVRLKMLLDMSCCTLSAFVRV